MMYPAAPTTSNNDLRPVVFHIAADYRCAHNPNGTSAIPELVACTREFAQHIVVSVRRTANPFKATLRKGSDVDWELSYFGLPFGVGIGASLRIAAWSLQRKAAADLRRANIIHAHKLSCEALIAMHCLRDDQRLVVSIRGSSDVKVARFHPWARHLMRKALLRARSVLWVSAWAQAAFDKLHLHCHPDARATLFPNIVEAIAPAATPLPARQPADPVRMCTVFRLDHFRLKGLPNLLQALASARQSGCNLQLDIIGGGTVATLGKINRLIETLQLRGFVKLLGAQPRVELRERITQYDAMVLPSRNETFGLAYLEALSAGVPVLYSLGTGIDGYLPPDSGAVGARANSVPSITAGIMRIAAERVQLQAQAAEYWHATGDANFSRARVCERYLQFVLHP